MNPRLFMIDLKFNCFSLKTLIYFVNDYLCVIHFGTKGLCVKWGCPV